METGMQPIYSALLTDYRYFADMWVYVAGKNYYQSVIVDTGAVATVFTAEILSVLGDDIKPICSAPITGAVKSKPYNVHRIKVDTLSIGDIKLNNQFIWYTDSKEVPDSVLGMDILRYLDMTQAGYSGNLKLRKAPWSLGNTVTLQNAEAFITKFLVDRGDLSDDIAKGILPLLSPVMELPEASFNAMLDNYIKDVLKRTEKK